MSAFPRKRQWTQLHSNIREFSKDSRGNFAMMTAILLVPMMGFSALALDHWAVATAKSEIENAADAAVLGTISRAAAIYKSTGNDRRASQDGRNAGNDQFQANAGKIPDTKIERFRINLKQTGLTFEADIEWRAQSNTRFSALFKWRRQELNGRSQASVTLPAYTQVHVLVDNSGSMGIGATQKAQDDLFRETSCAVACHLSGEDKYKIAQQKSISTRIDVVRNAFMAVAKNLDANQTTPNVLKIAVSTFSNDVEDLIDIDDEAARTVKGFQKAISTTIDVQGGLELTRKGGGTDFHSALDHMNKKLRKRSGKGLREDDPIIIFVFISDGVEHSVERGPERVWVIDKSLENKMFDPHPHVDEKGFSSYRFEGSDQRHRGWVQSLDPGLCSNIKRKDIRLVALEIEYLVPDRKYWGTGHGTDVRFAWIRDNLLAKNGSKGSLLNERFTECASKGEFHRASTADEIQASIKKIFDDIVPKPPRLSK